ncbi:MAG: dihydropteroate synthase [Chloroflexi bacterium]|nr:dihydropteroate synthase [Chloroflexota bacterium]
MGIINVTLDSFSGDGLGYDAEAALEQARRFVDEGADVIDVGGESTRPGSSPVPMAEELQRVLPVIKLLAREIDVPISIDTYKAEVAHQALAAGANMINDVWGLKHDPEIAKVAAAAGVPLIIMHNQIGTAYNDLIPSVLASLRESMKKAIEAGIKEENIILDPGIGFGKRIEHNLEIMHRLEEFKILGRPILLGTSRKSVIGRVLDLPPDQRLEGTAASMAIAIAKGVDMVRVHDVRAMVRVCRMSDAIVRGWLPDA